MTPGLDAGPLLAQQRTPIDPDEDAAQLEARLAADGRGTCCRCHRRSSTGTAKPIPQDATQASKAPRLKKEQGAIDWSRPAQEIKNQVRALRPWPRAFTFWHRARRRTTPPQHRPRFNTPSPFGRGQGEGFRPRHHPRRRFAPPHRHRRRPLEILELQPAGKRSMPASDFLRGHRVQPGDRFA